MTYRQQKGSVLIILVAIISIFVLLLIVGQSSLRAQKEANTLPEKQQKYLDHAKERLDLWYRQNAIRLDNVVGGTCPYTLTEEEVLLQASITPDYGVRVNISPCMSDGLLVYRDVAIWIPTKGFPDNSGFQLIAASNLYVFQPSDARVQYRLTAGKDIEARMVNETRTMLTRLANTLEFRFKSRIEADPSHDLRLNHFRPVDCAVPLDEDIPCTSQEPRDPNSDSYMLLDEANYDYLKLGPLVSLNRSELRDAWGQNIVFNNVLKVYSATEKDACVPEGGYPETPP